jgi:hypothetical protein
MPRNGLAGYAAFGAAILMVPMLLELVLVSISGRSFSAANLALSIALMIGGILWIKADRHSARRAP